MPYVPAAERRQQLLDAASRVIARKGVGGVTTREIAKEAGAAQASLHYVFSGKEDLLLALLHLATNSMEEMLSEARIPAGIGLKAAARSFMLAYHGFDRSVAFAQFNILLWSVRTELAKGESRRLYALWTEQLADALARAAQPDEIHVDFVKLAKRVHALCDGVQFINICNDPDYIDTEETGRIADAAVDIAIATAAPLADNSRQFT